MRLSSFRLPGMMSVGGQMRSAVQAGHLGCASIEAIPEGVVIRWESGGATLVTPSGVGEVEPAQVSVAPKVAASA